jgi:hypothetical protein
MHGSSPDHILSYSKWRAHSPGINSQAKEIESLLHVYVLETNGLHGEASREYSIELIRKNLLLSCDLLYCRRMEKRRCTEYDVGSTDGNPDS